MSFQPTSGTPSDRDVLSRTYIAAPCAVPWDSMSGDQRIRFCNQCELNVYNISEMSEKEAAQTIRSKEGRLCLRFYRRKDGTILTENCPVGLRRIRNLIRVCALAILTPLIWFGVMGQADAQGLVGAPVDPRYGVRGSYEPYAPSELSISPARNVLMSTTAITISVWIGALGIRKRARMNKIGITLAIVLAVVGFALGFIQ